MDKELHNHLATKMEGGLYAHIWVTPNIGAKEFIISKDYYTVIGGRVFAIEENGLYPSEDSLLTTETECRRIGKYDPNKTYKRLHNTMSYADIQKVLFA